MISLMRLMLGFFKLRSDSAVHVIARSEWLDDGIFSVHCFMLGVMISKLNSSLAYSSAVRDWDGDAS